MGVPKTSYCISPFSDQETLLHPDLLTVPTIMASFCDDQHERLRVHRTTKGKIEVK